MRTRFAEFYPPSKDELDELWTAGIVVLDANVLLNVYRIREPNELLRALEWCKARLWIPHHFALEYQRRRVSVIGEQTKAYGEAAASLKRLIDMFANERAPFVNQERLETLRALHGELRAEVERVAALLDDDPYLQRVSEILDGHLGSKPTAEDEAVMCQEAAARLKEHTPPGERDKRKAKRNQQRCGRPDVTRKKASVDASHKAADPPGEIAEGDQPEPEVLETPPAEAPNASNVFGDCLGWLQLLQHAESLAKMKPQAKAVPCMFLSDDRKDDWWHFEEVYGTREKRRIGPLPALVREYRERCGKRFHMYLPSQFLEMASKRGDLTVASSTISELKDLEHHVSAAGSGAVDPEKALDDEDDDEPAIDHPKGAERG